MSIWKATTSSEEKPWGEIINIITPFGMSGKIIYMNKGKRNSLKYYKRRNQALFCLSGKIMVIAPKENEFGNIVDRSKGSTFEVDPGELILIQSANPYRIKAIEDSVLVEVLLGQSSVDHVMLDDDYGRI